MKWLNDLKIVLVALIVVAAMVLVKTVDKSGFTGNAQQAVETVKSDNYFVLTNDLQGKESEYLIVEITITENPGANQFENSVKIPFEKLLEESSLEKLKATENKILLVSDYNNPITVKAWVILNQLNFNNVFVLADEENLEVLKYEFQPDSAAQLGNKY